MIDGTVTALTQFGAAGLIGMLWVFEHDDAGLAAQSALYSTRVKETAHQTRVLIDLDGDGLPEATRRIDVLALVRD